MMKATAAAIASSLSLPALCWTNLGNQKKGKQAIPRSSHNLARGNARQKFHNFFNLNANAFGSYFLWNFITISLPGLGCFCLPFIHSFHSKVHSSAHKQPNNFCVENYIKTIFIVVHKACVERSICVMP